MDRTPAISQLAVAALRDALTAAHYGDLAAVMGHLMSIDGASWAAIKERLVDLSAAMPTGTTDDLGARR